MSEDLNFKIPICSQCGNAHNASIKTDCPLCKLRVELRDGFAAIREELNFTRDKFEDVLGALNTASTPSPSVSNVPQEITPQLGDHWNVSIYGYAPKPTEVLAVLEDGDLVVMDHQKTQRYIVSPSMFYSLMSRMDLEVGHVVEVLSTSGLRGIIHTVNPPSKYKLEKTYSVYITHVKYDFIDFSFGESNSFTRNELRLLSFTPLISAN